MRLIELSVVIRSSTKLLIPQATLPLIYLNFKSTMTMTEPIPPILERQQSRALTQIHEARRQEQHLSWTLPFCISVL